MAHKILFIGGSFSIRIYAAKYHIQNHVCLQNSKQLYGFHNSIPAFIMDDAAAIYGSDFDNIIFHLKDNDFKVTYLDYQDEFPDPFENEEIVDNEPI